MTFRVNKDKPYLHFRQIISVRLEALNDRECNFTLPRQESAVDAGVGGGTGLLDGNKKPEVLGEPQVFAMNTP